MKFDKYNNPRKYQSGWDNYWSLVLDAQTWHGKIVATLATVAMTAIGLVAFYLMVKYLLPIQPWF